MDDGGTTPNRDSDRNLFECSLANVSALSSTISILYDRYSKNDSHNNLGIMTLFSDQISIDFHNKGTFFSNCKIKPSLFQTFRLNVDPNSDEYHAGVKVAINMTSLMRVLDFFQGCQLSMIPQGSNMNFNQYNPRYNASTLVDYDNPYGDDSKSPSSERSSPLLVIRYPNYGSPLFFTFTYGDFNVTMTVNTRTLAFLDVSADHSIGSSVFSSSSSSSGNNNIDNDTNTPYKLYKNSMIDIVNKIKDVEDLQQGFVPHAPLQPTIEPVTATQATTHSNISPNSTQPPPKVVMDIPIDLLKEIIQDTEPTNRGSKASRVASGGGTPHLTFHFNNISPQLYAVYDTVVRRKHPNNNTLSLIEPLSTILPHDPTSDELGFHALFYAVRADPQVQRASGLPYTAALANKNDPIIRNYRCSVESFEESYFLSDMATVMHNLRSVKESWRMCHFSILGNGLLHIRLVLSFSPLLGSEQETNDQNVWIEFSITSVDLHQGQVDWALQESQIPTRTTNTMFKRDSSRTLAAEEDHKSGDNDDIQQKSSHLAAPPPKRQLAAQESPSPNTRRSASVFSSELPYNNEKYENEDHNLKQCPPTPAQQHVTADSMETPHKQPGISAVTQLSNAFTPLSNTNIPTQHSLAPSHARTTWAAPARAPMNDDDRFDTFSVRSVPHPPKNRR